MPIFIRFLEAFQCHYGLLSGATYELCGQSVPCVYFLQNQKWFFPEPGGPVYPWTLTALFPETLIFFFFCEYLVLPANP